MLDAALPTKPAKRSARVSSAESAREKIVAKLTKSGIKGATSLYPPKTSEADRALYAAALASLEAEGAVFVDRRKAKPKFYHWDARPILPTVESVAHDLAELGQKRFPVLASEADFKRALGQDREQKALLPAALALLVESKRFVVLTFRSGKRQTALYVAAAALRETLRDAAPEPVAIPKTYAAIVARTGFPAVAISGLQRESGTELPALHEWLLTAHRSGRAVLSLGDWSLAGSAERAAALELHGERYLQVRLLS